jgi:deoxyribodipyrimidine photo-lyase
VIPLFVLDPYFFAPERVREHPHRSQFLLDSLTELATSVAALGSKLIVVAGESVDVVPQLARAWRADRVLAMRWVEPFGRERDRRIGEALGGALTLFEGETLLPPGSLRTGQGKPYSVFTRFARAFARELEVDVPLAAPRRLPTLPRGLRAERVRIPTLASLGVKRNPNLLAGGERAARQRMKRFLREVAASYHLQRDRMHLAGTSRLSADLKFGTLSVRELWHALGPLARTRGGRVFSNEILWREFAYSTLWDRPEVLEQPFRHAFVGFPWRKKSAWWRAWAEGRTGYPIVDAAARQLLSEGFVHNRARMIAASFLTKHLLIDYRRGEAHYLKFLTDGDWANNNLGWQWSAGSGCDAQPYFRVFNPVTQGKRFDPEGDYVRRWLPELAGLPPRFVHEPWEAPEAVLREAGVRLGKDYPRPIVDHRTARERFLALASEHLAQGRPGQSAITRSRSSGYASR